jgi:hypothetical protein
MSFIITNGLGGSNLLTWGYGAADLVASTAVRVFKIVDRGVVRMYDKLYKVIDRSHTVG